MENGIYEIIEISKKKIELKGVDKNIKVISLLKNENLKKGDFVKCIENLGNIMITEKIDPNSQKEEVKKNNEKNNFSKKMSSSTDNQENGKDKKLLMYPFNFVSLGYENEIEESRGPIKKGDYSG